MARWAALAAWLGVLLCLPAPGLQSRGLAASPAPSAGTAGTQQVAPPPPEPATPPPPPPPSALPASTPPPPSKKNAGKSSQGGGSGGGSTGSPPEGPGLEAAAPEPPPPRPECLTPGGLCDCLRAPGCAMPDTRVCNDIASCYANRDYLRSCCPQQRKGTTINCETGTGKQCPYMFTQLPVKLDLPGPGNNGQSQGSSSEGIQATTAPSLVGGTGTGGGGGITNPAAGSQPGSATAPSGGGGSGGSGGSRATSNQGQPAGGAGPAGITASFSPATVTTTTVLPAGCVEDNATCAASVCQPAMACGNLTAFRCAALNCGGTCVEQCVANPADWGPLGCPDMSGLDVSSCITCSTNNCADGTWCKPFDPLNATWFCSSPCAYTCEPQALK